jgi:flagellar biosynthesis protein FlhA
MATTIKPARGELTTALAVGLMAVIAMMVLPTPPFIVDLGLTLSFSLAILVFTITLFIERPLDFSAFPTILLASLVLRLALNIASTRLIIGDGHTGTDAAGEVIEGFATFIMRGNVLLGLVVFCAILIVNFMVITKGAARMAEVGARFALDGMPGRQLAIDSDVAAGAITHEEANERRRIEQAETTFFGSLDGASKFVKGDAVAGLLITLLNLVVGFGVGVGMHGLSVGAALETYSVLTVGDGLVSQIPSVITSVAAGLLLSKGGASGAADKVIFKQLSAYPLALFTVAGSLAFFAFVPGLPFAPFIMAAAGFGVAGALIRRHRKEEEAKPANFERAPPPQKSLGDMMAVDEIKVAFATDLLPVALDSANGLEARVAKIRNYIAGEFGFITPPIRLADDPELEPGWYAIFVHGVEAARFRLQHDRLLVIVDAADALSLPGEAVDEPVYGASARWIDPARRADAAAFGLPVIEPAEVLATHLLETIKANFGRLMTRRAARRILDEFVRTSDAAQAASNRQLVDEFVPERLPIETAQGVFRSLLEEGVSIRNLAVILEASADARAASHNADQIAEHVRRRLSRQITASLKGRDGKAPLIQLEPRWEEIFSQHEVVRASGQKDVALPPEEFNRLTRAITDQLRRAAAEGVFPAIVAFAERRPFLRAVLHAKGIRNPVVAYDELDPAVQPVLFGTA